MIKACLTAAALIGASAAMAQSASTGSGAMMNGSGAMSGAMSNSMGNDGTPPSTDMNNHASHAAAGGMTGNPEKCAKKYPTYDAATGMYTTASGKQKMCMVK